MTRLNYQLYYDIASPGTIWGNQSDLLIKPYLNANPGAKEQWTVAVPATPDADTIYAISVNGFRTVVDSGATPTQASLQEQLINALGSLLSNPIQPGTLIRTQVEVESSGTNILLTAKKYEQESLFVVTEGNGLTATLNGSTVMPAGINYGLFVVSANPANWREAKLPSAASDRILGVTMSPYDVEKDAFGEQGKAYFAGGDPMDVLTRTNGAEGIWVRSTSNDLLPGDPIYLSYAPATAGRVTKDPTDAIDLSAFASFQRPSSLVNTNQLIALVQVNIV